MTNESTVMRVSIKYKSTVINPIKVKLQLTFKHIFIDYDYQLSTVLLMTNKNVITLLLHFTSKIQFT